MPNIDYFFSTISPYTYLAGTELEDIAASAGATITYKPMDIVGLFGRTGGVPPKDRHISRQEYRLQDLERRSKNLGRPLHLKPAFWPTNPAPSSYAIIAAQKAGGGNMGGLVHSLTRTQKLRQPANSKRGDDDPQGVGRPGANCQQRQMPPVASRTAQHLPGDVQLVVRVLDAHVIAGWDGEPRHRPV